MSTKPTIPPDVQALLDPLLVQMQSILGDKLVGLYVYGSLVTGDFNPDISDLDLFATLQTDLNPDDFAQLDAMHNQWAATHPVWAGRLEIGYLSLHGLQTFRTQNSPMGNISPGEPFHMIEAGHLWLANWYVVRTSGITLFGPPPQEIIPSISVDEFRETVKAHVQGWREWINEVDARPAAQAYAIVTMCRAFYTVKNSTQVSKLKAADWAADQLPEWSTFIHNAVMWRRSWRNEKDGTATVAETRRFVAYMINLISDM
jgi:hypothetical protein